MTGIQRNINVLVLTKKSCIHKKVTLIDSEKNPAANIVRRECEFDKYEVERARRLMSYLIE